MSTYRYDTREQAYHNFTAQYEGTGTQNAKILEQLDLKPSDMSTSFWATLAHPNDILQHAAKHTFRAAVSINVRVIEESKTSFVGCGNRRARSRFPLSVRFDTLGAKNAPEFHSMGFGERGDG